MCGCVVCMYMRLYVSICTCTDARGDAADGAVCVGVLCVCICVYMCLYAHAQTQGATLLMVTHNPDVECYGDRVLYIQACSVLSCVCVCVCVCVCIYSYNLSVYLSSYIQTCIHIYIYTCIHIHLSIHTYIHVCIYNESSGLSCVIAFHLDSRMQARLSTSVCVSE
jgi:hypothetical protein